MENHQEQARDIIERFSRILWGQMAGLTRREAHAITSAMQTAMIMPHGGYRMAQVHRYLLWPKSCPMQEPSEDSEEETYVREFLALVAGFMGWYEEPEISRKSIWKTEEKKVMNTTTTTETTQNVVLVRHMKDPGLKQYLFALPNGKALKKDDRVIVETCKGVQKDGICTSDSFAVGETALAVVSALTGATLPLRRVLGVLHPEMWEGEETHAE